MVRLKNRDELKRIRDAGRILAHALETVKKMVEPGITTAELDAAGRDHIERQGGVPSFLGYMDYPASLCISINQEVIHGIPGPRKLRPGDIVSIDVGVEYQGCYADAAVSVPVGTVNPDVARLMSVTQECLNRGIAQAKNGNRVQHISHAVQELAEAHGYGIVRQFCGHGVGFSQHEDPQIPNYVGRGPNPRLKSGMVLAIEPMICLGDGEVRILDDDWTVVTSDAAVSAHFEHTVALFPDHTEIMTLP
jgi:methionyl aminopeptidase